MTPYTSAKDMLLEKPTELLPDAEVQDFIAGVVNAVRAIATDGTPSFTPILQGLAWNLGGVKADTDPFENTKDAFMAPFNLPEGANKQQILFKIGCGLMDAANLFPAVTVMVAEIFYSLPGPDGQAPTNPTERKDGLCIATATFDGRYSTQIFAVTYDANHNVVLSPQPVIVTPLTYPGTQTQTAASSNPLLAALYAGVIATLSMRFKWPVPEDLRGYIARLLAKDKPKPPALGRDTAGPQISGPSDLFGSDKVM